MTRLQQASVAKWFRNRKRDGQEERATQGSRLNERDGHEWKAARKKCTPHQKVLQYCELLDRWTLQDVVTHTGVLFRFLEVDIMFVGDEPIFFVEPYGLRVRIHS